MALTARERLIDSTIELIATNGVAATGISELIEHSDVSRRTIYVNFPGGKAELVTDATKSAGQSMTAVLQAMVANSSVDVALPAFGAWWANTLKASDFDRGCPIMAAAWGRAEAPDAADVARATLANWVEVLRTRLEADGMNSSESLSLAVTMVAGIEGAVLMCIAEKSIDPLDQTVRQLLRLLTVTRLA